MATAADVDTLISQLFDYRTRAKARRRLEQLGPTAADRLLVLLADPETAENVRWSAITLLALYGTKEAVPLLVGVARDVLRLRAEALQALKLLTGQDFGDDVPAWERALGGDRADAAKPESFSPDEATCEGAVFGLFRAAIGDLATRLSWEEEGYIYARIPLSGGRKQQVAVTLDEEDAAGNRLAGFYTECGPASAEAVESVSRRNVTLRYGAFLIEEDNDTKKVVLRHSHPVSGLTSELIRDVLTVMAREADNLEFEITQSDRI